MVKSGSAGDGFIPRVGRFPGKGNGGLNILAGENPMGKERNLVCFIVMGSEVYMT